MLPGVAAAGRLRWTPRRGVRAAEGARLEIAYVVKAASRVQIPPSPYRRGNAQFPRPLGRSRRSPGFPAQHRCVCAAASAETVKGASSSRVQIPPPPLEVVGGVRAPLQGVAAAGRLRWTPRRGVRAAEGARLEIAYVVKAASRVQIPPSPYRRGNAQFPRPLGRSRRSPGFPAQHRCVCAAASAVVGPTSARSEVLETGSTFVLAEAGISGRN